MDGFDLHASAAVRATNRDRLESLSRYLLRPPVANDGGTTPVAVPPDVPLPAPTAVDLHAGSVLIVSAGAAVVYRP